MDMSILLMSVAVGMGAAPLPASFSGPDARAVFAKDPGRYAFRPLGGPTADWRSSAGAAASPVPTGCPYCEGDRGRRHGGKSWKATE